MPMIQLLWHEKTVQILSGLACGIWVKHHYLPVLSSQQGNLIVIMASLKNSTEALKILILQLFCSCLAMS
jgi:hypothetical protein